LINKHTFCYKREKKGGLPALFVSEAETFSYIRESGSQRKLSVVRPDTSGIMPDLAFEVSTCLTGIQVFVLHGKVGFLISQLQN